MIDAKKLLDEATASYKAAKAAKEALGEFNCSDDRLHSAHFAASDAVVAAHSVVCWIERMTATVCESMPDIDTLDLSERV